MFQESGDIVIQPIRHDEIATVVGIANQELGTDFITPAEIKRYLANPSKYTLLVARKNNETVGFCSAYKLTPAEIQAMAPRPELPTPFSITPQTGMLKTMAVQNAHTKQGIGTKLVSHILDILVQDGIKEIYSIGWKKDGKVSIGNILLRHGFKQHRNVENYWFEDSILKNYDCALCGPPPCRCHAAIFVKTG